MGKALRRDKRGRFASSGGRKRKAGQKAFETAYKKGYKRAMSKGLGKYQARKHGRAAGKKASYGYFSAHKPNIL